MHPMLTPAAVRTLALSLPEAQEHPHFEKPSFRVRKKIFATLQPADKKAVLKLSPVDQSAFTAYDQTIFYPVPDTWGKGGWTMVDLTKVKKPCSATPLPAPGGRWPPKPSFKSTP